MGPILIVIFKDMVFSKAVTTDDENKNTSQVGHFTEVSRLYSYRLKGTTRMIIIKTLC